jgi:hypothetical protein
VIPAGLADKLYWRQTARGARWHCFKRLGGARSAWVPLCGASLTLSRSGGQASCRPPSLLRCPICDGREMARRGWEEGGDASPNWQSAQWGAA